MIIKTEDYAAAGFRAVVRGSCLSLFAQPSPPLIGGLGCWCINLPSIILLLWWLLSFWGCRGHKGILLFLGPYEVLRGQLCSTPLWSSKLCVWAGLHSVVATEKRPRESEKLQQAIGSWDSGTFPNIPIIFIYAIFVKIICSFNSGVLVGPK